MGLYRCHVRSDGSSWRESIPTAIVKDELTAALLSRCAPPWGWGFIEAPTPW
jgi:hypothetical protein